MERGPQAIRELREATRLLGRSSRSTEAMAVREGRPLRVLQLVAQTGRAIRLGAPVMMVAQQAWALAVLVVAAPLVAAALEVARGQMAAFLGGTVTAMAAAAAAVAVPIRQGRETVAPVATALPALS